MWIGLLPVLSKCHLVALGPKSIGKHTPKSVPMNWYIGISRYTICTYAVLHRNDYSVCTNAVLHRNDCSICTYAILHRNDYSLCKYAVPHKNDYSICTNALLHRNDYSMCTYAVLKSICTLHSIT